MEEIKKKYILVNISIPILLYETGQYDQYPDYIQVSYIPIEELPVMGEGGATYELNLADYFGEGGGSGEIRDTDVCVDMCANIYDISSTQIPTPQDTPIVPVLDLMQTVVQKTYLNIVRKDKSKIHKSNTTFRNKSSSSHKFPNREFTRKTWKYVCDITD